ncbi:MAG: tRNA lysidine(34) synthetase TilS [Chloroflexota bacterium]
MKERPLEQRILLFLREQRLIAPTMKLVVAVSGGADSVCLLHVLHKLSPEPGVSLHVAHLDHRIRGAAAEEDARYVTALARRMGIPVTVDRRDVPRYREEHRLSLEEAAREVRYNFLSEVARTVGAAAAAVGHTRDDHVETVLMHFLRGSGTQGLRGLAPRQRWSSVEGNLEVIRPLLSVSREETVAYCRRHRLATRQDATNLSLHPLRNRVRLDLLPRLAEYNPQVAEALRRTATLARDEFEFLEEAARKAWPEVCRQVDGAVLLDKAAFGKLPPALQRQMLRRSIAALRGNLKDLSATHIEDLMAVRDKGAGKIITLPEGLTFAVQYDHYRLGIDVVETPFPELKDQLELKIPGETVLPGWRVTAELSDGAPAETADGPFTARFDFARTGPEIVLRSRRRGDRFQPLGMGQSKKLYEFMIDRKIPQAWRDRVPILAAPPQIIWVAGYRIDDRVKVTAATRRVLRIRLERQP